MPPDTEAFSNGTRPSGPYYPKTITHTFPMMKNRIAILLALISLPVLTKAQSPIGDGGTQLNFGAGLYSHGIPVYFGMDFGVHPDISLGFQTGLDLEFDYFTVA